MLWNSTAINGFAIQATDGNLGTVSDILFEDSSWTVRWLVVDTGNWLPGRKVLLPFSTLGEPDRELRRFPVKLTRQQVKNSPDIDTDKSVSRQHETHVFDYDGLDSYWGGGLYPISNGMAVPFAGPLAPDQRKLPEHGVTMASTEDGSPNLRSVAAVTGYHIHATDGEIGYAADFLVNDANWMIRYVKVNTRNWWPGQLVLISPGSVRQIDWAERLIHLNVTRQIVRGSPAYRADMTVGGAYDERFDTYYGPTYLGMM